MSGEVVATTYQELGDKPLSLGHFFHIAKTSLGAAEHGAEGTARSGEPPLLVLAAAP